MSISLLSTIVRLLGAFLIVVGLAFNVSPAAAAPKEPQPKIAQVGDEELSNKSAVTHAAIDGVSFDFFFVLMSGGFPRLVIENVSGDGNVAITGSISSAGYADIQVDERVREVKYPGIKLGGFKDLPYDTVQVSFKVSINGNAFPEFTLGHKHGPVHPWVKFPEFPKLCKASVGVQDDPGVKVFIDGILQLMGWYKDTPVTVGTFDFADGPHTLRVETFKPKNGGEQWEKINQTLDMSWNSVGCSATPPPTLTSAECNSMSPNYVALKPGEKQVFTLTGTRVVSSEIALDGQAVSNSNTFNFTASDVMTHTITGKVAGEDGVWNTAKACNAMVIVSQTPPPHIPTSAVCGSLTPTYVGLKPGEKQVFTLTGSDVLTYSIALDGQPVSQTNTYEFVASDIMTHTLAGFVAGEDGVFNTAKACNAMVVVSPHPIIIVPPTPETPPTGPSWMTATVVNIADCRTMDQYPGEFVLWRGQHLVHINVGNRNPEEKWAAQSAKWTVDGSNWTQVGSTREVGIESRGKPVMPEVRVDWTVVQTSNKVPETMGKTQELASNKMPAVNVFDYNQLIALDYHLINPSNGQLVGPTAQNVKPGGTYKWIHDTMVARCKPQATVVPPSFHNAPPASSTPVGGCFQTPEGGIGKYNFQDGIVPAGYTKLLDEECNVTPPGLPNTSGGATDEDIAAILAGENQGIMFSILAIFALFIGLLMLISSRRFASAKTR